MPGTHANGKISILTHRLRGLRLPIIFLALLSVIAGATLAPRAFGGAPMACLYTNRSQGPLYTVTVVERGLCGYGFEFDVHAISYPPTCYSNMTGSLFPFTSNPTMKLYAGRYWYGYHAYGSPFSGGEGNFTVSGPTTVYLDYGGVPTGYCDNKLSIDANVINAATATENVIQATALRASQGYTLVTFNESGLTSGLYWNLMYLENASEQYANSPLSGAHTPNVQAGSEFNVSLPDGNYSYGAACSTGPTQPLYDCGGMGGTFNVEGSQRHVTVQFLPVYGIATMTNSNTMSTNSGATTTTINQILSSFLDCSRVPSAYQPFCALFALSIYETLNLILHLISSTQASTSTTTSTTVTTTSTIQSTTCQNTAGPEYGNEGPCITVSASQCVSNQKICPDATTPLYNALTLEFVPANNYYETFTDTQMQNIFSDISQSLGGLSVRVLNLPNNEPYKYVVIDNTQTATQNALEGLAWYLCSSEVVEIVATAGAESEGSALAAVAIVANKASTEFPCYDTMTNSITASLNTEVAAVKGYSDAVIRSIEGGNVGLTEYSYSGGPNIDYQQNMIVAGSSQQFQLTMKLSAPITNMNIPVSGTGYVFSASTGAAWQSGPACGSLPHCITLTSASFAQNVNVGPT